MTTSINVSTSRREFLAKTTATAAALMSANPWSVAEGAAADSPTRPKVAAVFTELRFRSHAYDILENFMGPYLFNGKLTDPGVDVVSFYAEQFPQGDMAREASRRLGVPLFKTIGDAVCLGGKELAVDAVLSIGEHGDYPYNKLGQKMYPRKRFFDAIVAPMKRADRFVPIFNDKHLSYRWDWAKEMYDTAQRHGIPFLAGSSVPLAQRIPPIELPPEAEIEEAVSIHGGGFESYDFHGLEVLQSFVEARKGGEPGVSEVEVLSAGKLRQALRSGRISQKLVDAAMQAEKEANLKRRLRPSTGRRSRKGRPRKKGSRSRRAAPKIRQPAAPHALALRYKDGFRATVLKVGNSANRWNFACRLRGESEPRATALSNGPWGNRCLFKALSHAIQHLFVTRQVPYPIERTLLVTGVLEAAVRSFNQGEKAIETPHLELGYQPIDFRSMREQGGSWKIITVNTPEPPDFRPGADARFVNH